MKISPYLTPGMHRVLKLMRDDEEAGGELVQDGLECWIGLERTNCATVNNLLRMCLIKESSFGGGTRVFELNGDGLKIIDDPEYVPSIITALQRKRK